MQGVSINIFIKTATKRKNELGKVFYSEIFGERGHKYHVLQNNSLTSIGWSQIKMKEINYLFKYKMIRDFLNMSKALVLINYFQFIQMVLRPKEII